MGITICSGVGFLAAVGCAGLYDRKGSFLKPFVYGTVFYGFCYILWSMLLFVLNQFTLFRAVLGTAVVLVALLVLFFGTELGCALRATGCNPVMSRAQGVNTGLMKVIGLALSNGVVALSGALLCQYQGYTDVNMGRGAVVIGLAAVVIGQAVLGRRGGRMAVQLGGVILGAVIYYIVYQVIIFAGFDTDLLKMFSAVVVAVFLGAPHVKAQLKAHSRSKKGDSGHAENE